MVDDINRLLIRYLNGTASAAEEAQVECWAEVAPENRELLARLRESWALAGTLPTQRSGDGAGRYDTAAELERLLGRIRSPERDAIPFFLGGTMHPLRRRAKWYASPLLRVAALLAVVIGTAVLLSPPHDVFFTTPVRSYATAVGERMTVQLGDGSRIVLGPASELRLPSRFPREQRNVYLQGTAYFEVAPDPARPFRVHAAGTVTRVLGTRFVVRAYAGDPTVDVGVAEGRVAVRAETAPEEHGLALVSGQIGQVGPGGVARVLERSSLDPLFGWAQGRLVFRERPLGEVARELERWYAIQIRIPDPRLAERPITLSFRAAPLDEVLRVITFSLGAEIEREGQTVTLHPAGAEP